VARILIFVFWLGGLPFSSVPPKGFVVAGGQDPDIRILAGRITFFFSSSQRFQVDGGHDPDILIFFFPYPSYLANSHSARQNMNGPLKHHKTTLICIMNQQMHN